LAVANTSGAHDFAALGRCVAKLKASSTEFADDDGITLSANPDIPFQTLVSAMDAVRTGADGTELFPDVRLGIAR
jgi:hypothetical protein